MYDCTFPAGSVQEHRCPVCDSICTVERDKVRPRISGWASAMAWHGIPEHYDLFHCPNNGEGWHCRAMEYQEELKRTKSPSVRALIERDIEEALSEGDE